MASTPPIVKVPQKTRRNERRLARMFKLYDQEEQYIERDDDFENTESNTYAACVYAQLSLGQNVTEGLQVPVHEYCF